MTLNYLGGHKEKDPWRPKREAGDSESEKGRRAQSRAHGGATADLRYWEPEPRAASSLPEPGEGSPLGRPEGGGPAHRWI